MEKAKKFVFVVFILVILFALYLSSLWNYLLFHSLTEVFSVCIAFTVFLLAWNCEKYLKGNYFIVLGVAYLFIGIIDLFHMFTYKGMRIFGEHHDYATQLWIAARYLESLTLLSSFILLKWKRKYNIYSIFSIYTVIVSGIFVSTFLLQNFPECYIKGTGLTTFKLISEYVICCILLVSMYFLYKNKEYCKERIYKYLMLSIFFTIASELAFTFYIDKYGISNLIGHYFKIFSFYLIYKALIQEGIKAPYDVIFQELKENEAKLYSQNIYLEKLSHLDGLTMLNNHNYICERLIEEIKRVERYGEDLSVIMLDIDLFKKVNDKYGHQMGDEVLKNIAHLIKENVRLCDIPGRYGGEEFLVILPEADKDKSLIVAEKIRKKVEKMEINNIKVTISGGIAQYKKGDDCGILIQKADEKLYEAKTQGRNRNEM